jgi:hypothetical protein
LFDAQQHKQSSINFAGDAILDGDAGRCDPLHYGSQ